MGLSGATLAGHKVTSGKAWLPDWGAWHADISIDGEVEMSGLVDLVIADAKFEGTILSGGAAKGRSDFRIVGGKAGWGKTIPQKSYANDAGVKLATVIGDAAQEAGETLDMTTVDASQRLGVAWARRKDQACRVLEQVAPSAWYIGEDGITRLGRRARKPFTGAAARVTPIDKARGTLTLAAESIKALVPGVIVDGLTAVDVVHELAPKTGLRTKIYGARGVGSTSRRLTALRLLLDQLDPDRAFRGIYEYRVVTLSGSRANLQAVLVSTGMPDLQRVPIRPGVSGAKSTIALGSRVIVGFVNADQTAPAVIAVEDADGAGFKPVLTSIDAETFLKLGAGVKPVAAAGDFAGPFPIIPTQIKVLV